MKKEGMKSTNILSFFIWFIVVSFFQSLYGIYIYFLFHLDTNNDLVFKGASAKKLAQ